MAIRIRNINLTFFVIISLLIMLDINKIYYRLPFKRRLAFRCFINFLYDKDALSLYQAFFNIKYFKWRIEDYIEEFGTINENLTCDNEIDFFIYYEAFNYLSQAFSFPYGGKIDWYKLNLQWREIYDNNLKDYEYTQLFFERNIL